MVITVLGMVAELERSFIRERQQEGIEAAKRKGTVYKGRPKKVRPEIRTLAEEGLGPTAIAKRLGISRMTVYRELTTD
jgi:DNA invertase Pin-like site-specific DNA recombinase